MTLLNGVATPTQNWPRITFSFTQPTRAFGTWVFDEAFFGQTANSRFVLLVTDIYALTTTSPPLDAGGSPWQIEGFLGVVSSAGLLSVTVIMQDAITGQVASGRYFELDNVQVVEGNGVSFVGTGCPGSGTLASLLMPNQLPFLGNSAFSVTATQGIPGNMAFLFAAIGVASAPVPLGGGCTLYLDPASLATFMNVGIGPIPAPIGATGQATYLLPIPVFWTTGTNFALQAALADPSYLPTGFSVTNALLLTVL
jgi:hypothetical protein